jgi:hypothetical protein
MLARYHMTTFAAILSLGLLGYFFFPTMGVPMQWTVVLLVGMAMLVSNAWAFGQSARYSSPVVISESHRWSRYLAPTRYASDGRMTWAATGVVGWTFMKFFLNSGSNPAVAIYPARLAESKNDLVLILRVKFYRLSPQSVRNLRKKREFRRLLDQFKYDEVKNTPSVYFGFQSTSLHDDGDHTKSTIDPQALSSDMNESGNQWRQQTTDLRDGMDASLSFFERLKGSKPAQSVVNSRRKSDDDQEADR